MKSRSMRPVCMYFVLMAILIAILNGLDAHGMDATLGSQSMVPAFDLSPGMRVQWSETEAPGSFTDRCQSVELSKKGRYKVEIQSPSLSSGLWIETDTVEAHVVARTVGIRFRVCRSGYVTICETTAAALGPVALSVVEEEPDPLEVLVDEDPFRIDLCDPWAFEALGTLLETVVDMDH